MTANIPMTERQEKSYPLLAPTDAVLGVLN
jgi:hypothetical protein